MRPIYCLVPVLMGILIGSFPSEESVASEAVANAALLGPWRVTDLAEPLLLQPGFYAIGGLDTSATTDVIRYVFTADPGGQSQAPPGSPVLIGPFFYADGVSSAPGFGPPTSYYLSWGLELGPMLFGTNGPEISTGSGLSISRLPLAKEMGMGTLMMLTWPTGTLQQADAVGGLYIGVPNGASPYIVPPHQWPPSSLLKFYRLGP